jgi:hypothetical protein
MENKGTAIWLKAVFLGLWFFVGVCLTLVFIVVFGLFGNHYGLTSLLISVGVVIIISVLLAFVKRNQNNGSDSKLRWMFN